VRGDGAKRSVSHVVDQVVIHDVTRPDDPDAAPVGATLRELLHEIATLAARHEGEHGIRSGSLHSLEGLA
jgi:hypothetical protein